MTEYTPEKVNEMVADLRRMAGGPNAGLCTPACPRGVQHFHAVPWQETVADALEAVTAERDEALAVIADALPMIGLMRPWNTSPEQIENVRRILSRITDKEGRLSDA